GSDSPAATAENPDVRGIEFAQAVDHVAKEFDVAALVGTNGYAVGVFLDCRADDVVYAAVVAQMDDLGSLRLDQPAHYVDSGVVAVEQRGRCDKPERGFRCLAGSLRQVAGGHAHLFRRRCGGLWRLGSHFSRGTSGISQESLKIQWIAALQKF